MRWAPDLSCRRVPLQVRQPHRVVQVEEIDAADIRPAFRNDAPI
jgi:hypothetical protein